MKVLNSDKLASSSGWTKAAISNANKISCSVWEGGCSWGAFVFELEICFVQNYPYTLFTRILQSPHPLCQKKPQKHWIPSTAYTPTHTPTHPHHHCTHPLTCSKAAFPQAFPLKGQIFHLCNSVPYWFLEDCSDLLDVQWWPKCSPGREVFSFHSQRFTCIFPRKESVWPNQLSCSLCFLWCYLHMCLCIFYLSIYL